MTLSAKARAGDGWLGNQIHFGLREQFEHGREAPGPQRDERRGIA
jgi:hypothetical protein